jgi:prepilin-type N-terminal cleavage/methylation domain-containing protein
MEELKLQMPKTKAKLLNGYTLLELLIVISLITVVFTLGFARYQDFQKRQQLEAVILGIRSDLRLAQEFSIAGRKPDVPVGNDCETSSLNGYVFRRLSASTYQVEAECVSGNVIVRGPISISTGVSLGAIPGTPTDEILFKILGRGVDRGSNTTLTLTQTGTGATAQITITPSGEIR